MVKVFKGYLNSSSMLPNIVRDRQFVENVVEKEIEEIQKEEEVLSKEDKELADEIMARSSFNESVYAAYSSDEDETEHDVVKQAIHDHIHGNDDGDY